MSNFDDVGAFHEKFGLRRVGEPGPATSLTFTETVELLEFRFNFMLEELVEFQDGMDTDDHTQMADALIDLVYVAMGTAHLLGYPWRELWDEVQAANMKKERAASDGSNSKRGSRWDVVKPPDWRPPRVSEILEHYGY